MTAEPNMTEHGNRYLLSRRQQRREPTAARPKAPAAPAAAHPSDPIRSLSAAPRRWGPTQGGSAQLGRAGLGWAGLGWRELKQCTILFRRSGLQLEGNTSCGQLSKK